MANDMNHLLGWVPPDERNSEQTNEHDRIMRTIPKPRFSAGDPPPIGTTVLLTESWKSAAVNKLLGRSFTGIHQLTGSCVWAGAQNVGFTRCLLDVERGEFEELIYPFMFGNYGRSRSLAGMRGRGEGSLGSTMAKSCQIDGSPSLLVPGIPNFTGTDDGFYYTSNMELAWSDGGNPPVPAVMVEGKKHLDNVVQVDSADAVRDHLLARNPVSTAYGAYVSNSSAHQVGELTVGKYDSSGGHQTSWLGYTHREEGEFFLYMNQWPRSYYPKAGLGAPLCSIWLPKSAVDNVCKSGDGEVFAWLDKNGYMPATFSNIL